MLKRLILIAASTGGPGHIQKILSSLPSGTFPPVIIIQHMQNIFVPTFASSMRSATDLNIQVVSDGMKVECSQIYICAQNVKLEYRDGLYFTHVHDELPYTPHIDTVFTSASKLTDRYEILSVVLTGIGDDGASGCKLLGEKGSECLSECEEDCPVYGMPRNAANANPKAKVLHLNDIAKRIVAFGHNQC